MNINNRCNSYQVGIPKKCNFLLNSNACLLFHNNNYSDSCDKSFKNIVGPNLNERTNAEVSPGVIDFQIWNHRLKFAMLRNSYTTMLKNQNIPHSLFPQFRIIQILQRP